MKTTSLFLCLFLVGVLMPGMPLTSRAQEAAATQADLAADPTRLAVVWTSGDPDVAHRVCLMYTHAARQAKWFDEVTLVVWGPSARLLAADKDLQAKVKSMKADGVIVRACVVCADSYGVTEKLSSLGLTVEPMGKPLSDFLKNGWKVLTF
jgi:hypothetical protein